MATNKKSKMMRIPAFGFRELERIANENDLDMKHPEGKTATWGILCAKLKRSEKNENETKKLFRI